MCHLQRLTSSFTDGSAKDLHLVRYQSVTGQGTNNVVIESELSANKVKVGQTITVKTTADDAKTVKLTVVGIYKVGNENDRWLPTYRSIRYDLRFHIPWLIQSMALKCHLTSPLRWLVAKTAAFVKAAKVY